jgi:hypothetical protein
MCCCIVIAVLLNSAACRHAAVSTCAVQQGPCASPGEPQQLHVGVHSAHSSPHPQPKHCASQDAHVLQLHARDPSRGVPLPVALPFHVCAAGSVILRFSSVRQVNIQTNASVFGVDTSIKHGLAHPRNMSSEQMFRRPRLLILCLHEH